MTHPYYEGEIQQGKTEREIKSLHAQLEIAIEALNAVKNNGAKAKDEKWDVIDSALIKIAELRSQK